MSLMTFDTTTAVHATVGAASTSFGAMVAGRLYAFTSTTTCWITQGQGSSTPTATKGDLSTIVGAGQTVYLDGTVGAKVAVIQDTAGGSATLTMARSN